MKKYLIITLIAILSLSIKANAQIHSVYDSIAILDLNRYATLPVDSLLRVLPRSYNDIGFYGTLKNNKVAGLSIHYPGGTQILIKPLIYTYMNPIDPLRTWNFNQFKFEIAHFILVIAEEGTLCGQE